MSTDPKASPYQVVCLSIHLRQEVEDGGERRLGLVVVVEEERGVARAPRVLFRRMRQTVIANTRRGWRLTWSETPHEVIPMQRETARQALTTVV